MDNQWWITGLDESTDDSKATKLSNPIPDNFDYLSSRRNNLVMVGEEFFLIDEHFNRIRNIFLAPIFILAISVIIPPAAALLLFYPIYIIYSFLVSMDLKGKHLALGFLMGNLLFLPAIINIIQWNLNAIGITFLIPFSYVFYLLFALDSDSIGHKKAAIGMFYGIIFGAIICLPFFGIAIAFSGEASWG
ncbi:MAG: hypothetical protein CMA30_08330 [Euryarchaeota archaeon]|nr:hypothetical protein [Euryarchaeota archaeon]|tara:strand:- start:1638 stop:2207 length:570 start_codon:yes stop_codon:yes gene_type:complete